ncbi:MAG: hypothetical protein AAF420_01920 [Pseudomonadota bacterium]
MADEGHAGLRPALLHPRYWGKWCTVLLLSVICLLPWRLIDWLGARVGRIAYQRYEKHRRHAQMNLEWCFPDIAEQARDELIQDHFCVYWQTLMQSPVLWWGSRPGYAKRVEFSGLEHFERAREQGPVIVLSCHSIALDFGAAAIAWHYSAVSMYQTFKHPIDDWLVYRGRARFNNTLVRRGSSLRTLIRLTREGTPCYHMPDEDLGPEGAVFAPFFGKPKATVVGMAKMTRSARATVVPCFPYYIGGGRFRLQFLEPLENYPLDDEVENSTVVNRAIERLIGVAPAHYLWKLRLFKTREDGSRNTYRNPQ